MATRASKKSTARAAKATKKPAEQKAPGKATARSTKKGAKEERPSILEQLAPAPTEGDDVETLEFLRAIDAFKRKSGRSFPSYTELLGILKSLGYRKEPSRS